MNEITPETKAAEIMAHIEKMNELIKQGTEIGLKFEIYYLDSEKSLDKTKPPIVCQIFKKLTY